MLVDEEIDVLVTNNLQKLETFMKILSQTFRFKAKQHSMNHESFRLWKFGAVQYMLPVKGFMKPHKLKHY